MSKAAELIEVVRSLHGRPGWQWTERKLVQDMADELERALKMLEVAETALNYISLHGANFTERFDVCAVVALEELNRLRGDGE